MLEQQQHQKQSERVEPANVFLLLLFFISSCIKRSLFFPLIQMHTQHTHTTYLNDTRRLHNSPKELCSQRNFMYFSLFLYFGKRKKNGKIHRQIPKKQKKALFFALKNFLSNSSCFHFVCFKSELEPKFDQNDAHFNQIFHITHLLRCILLNYFVKLASFLLCFTCLTTFCA